MTQSFALFWVLMLTGLWGIPSQTRAQELEIVPISQQLEPGQRSASFTLTNGADSESMIQIRSFAWTQDGQGDVLKATNQLVISPPFARIGPGQSQTVRLMLREPPKQTEQAYRLVFDQLPGNIDGKVEMTLRLIVPVFAKALATAQPDLQWRITLLNGTPTLIVVNHGLLHSKLLGLELSGTDGQSLKLLNQGLPYVLAGAERHWSISDLQKRLSTGTRVRLKTSDPEGPHEQWLVIGDKI